jgi:integrase
MPLSDVIAHYTAKKAPTYAVTEDTDPAAARRKAAQGKYFADRMGWLLDYWAAKVVDEIDPETCAEFSARHTPSVARRCLEDLRAAVRRCIKDRRLARDGEWSFELPSANPARYGFYTRGQVARMLWKAYRMRQTYTHSGKRARPEKRGSTKQIDAHPRRHVARFILVGVYTGTRTDRIEQASFYPEPGRPYVDVDAGIFYRAAAGEFVPDNKRAGPVRIPPRLLGHLRRWKKNGARYVVEFQGKPVDASSAYFRNQREALTAAEIKAHRLNRHALKHTCATWLMLSGQPLADIASFLDTDERTIIRHYGHHHPDHQAGVGQALSQGAGKVRFGRDAKPKAAERPTAANSPAVAAEVRRSIREMLELLQAPVVAFGVVDTTPDAGLEALRESVKRSFRSGDWSGLAGQNVP